MCPLAQSFGLRLMAREMVDVTCWLQFAIANEAFVLRVLQPPYLMMAAWL